MRRRVFGYVLTALALTIAAPAGAAVADVSDASSTPASCMGIEAAALSPPGSNLEAQGGMPELRVEIGELAPGVPPGQAFYSGAAHLHEGSHDECDVALGG